MGFAPRGQTLADSMAVAKTLEAFGVDSLWVGDGYDAFVHAAAIASVTHRTTIGTCVTLLTRTPVQTVSACGGLDELSEGRFVLGLGVGPADWNRDWHGLNPDRPARRMAEYLQCFKAAWRSGPDNPANVEGEIFSVRNYRRMRRSPSENLPTLVGVVGPQNTRNGARYADGVIFDVVLHRGYIESVGLPAVQEGLRLAGKTRDQITVGGLFSVSVDKDRGEARRRARNGILLHIPVDYYAPAFAWAGFAEEAEASRQALARGDVTAALDAISEEMVDALTLAGTPDEVRAMADTWDDVVELMVAFPPSHFLPPDEAVYAQDQLLRCFLT